MFLSIANVLLDTTYLNEKYNEKVSNPTFKTLTNMKNKILDKKARRYPVNGSITSLGVVKHCLFSGSFQLMSFHNQLGKLLKIFDNVVNI